MYSQFDVLLPHSIQVLTTYDTRNKLFKSVLSYDQKLCIFSIGIYVINYYQLFNL